LVQTILIRKGGMGQANWSVPLIMKTEKIKDALSHLLKAFETNDLPKKVAKTFIHKNIEDKGKPSDKWSLGNKIIMLISGTEDARGYRQWQSVERQVKKGSKAIYILAPCTKKITEEITDLETGEAQEVEKFIINGFREIPVFRYEDTEGKLLPDIFYEPPELPPLLNVAKKLDLNVKYLPFKGKYLGTFRPGEITLYSHDVRIFFHELAHAAHHTFRPLKSGQHSDQEIVAETTACALCELYDCKGYIWEGWKYIQNYSEYDTQKALKAIMGVLADVEKVLNIILSNDSDDLASDVA